MYLKKRLCGLWVKVLDFVRKACMLLSFFSMVVCFVLMLYECYEADLVRTATFGTVVCVSIFLNHQLQE